MTSHSLVFADSTPILDPIDVHREFKRRRLTASGKGQFVQGGTLVDSSQPLDVSWVRLAASAYNISPDIQDYIMVPVILFHANVPNRNSVGFSMSDLASFSREYGMQLYKTWKGKPVHHEHENDNPVEAKGVVLDTFMKRDGPFWKVIAYLSIDRDKDSVLANRIAKKELKTYSMGAYITGGFQCSKCGAAEGNCIHLNKSLKGQETERSMNILPPEGNGTKPELVYLAGRYPVGFEVSAVENPAFIMAENDVIQQF